MIEVGLFCLARNNSYGDYGVVKGDLVYVAGDFMSPASDGKDPYNYRKLFLIAKTLEGGHVDATAQALTVDAKNIKPVSKAKQKELYKQLEEDFAQEEADETTD